MRQQKAGKKRTASKSKCNNAGSKEKKIKNFFGNELHAQKHFLHICDTHILVKTLNVNRTVFGIIISKNFKFNFKHLDQH